MGAYLDYLGSGQPAAGGHFRLGLSTGSTTTIAGGAAILCLRWTDPAHYFVLLSCQIEAAITTAFTTAQLVDAALFVNHSWTTAPSGGTSVYPFAIPGTGKMRVQGGGMQNSLVSTLQIATTAALTTGTRVPDSNAIGEVQLQTTNTLGGSDTRTLYSLDTLNDHALVLGVNEGIEIQIPTTQGAVGVVKYYVNLRWAEVTQY